MNRVFLLLLFLYSCSDSSGNKIEETTEYCNNESKMVQAESSVPTVSFGLDEEKEQVIGKLNPLFPSDDCGPYFFFGWNNKHHPNLKLTYYDETRCIYEGVQSTTTIAINNRSQIMIDYESFIDSLEHISSIISKKLIDNYLDNDMPGAVVLVWQEGTQAALIESVIHQSIEGYLKAAKITSTTMLNKDLCDLEVPELNELKEVFPFILIMNHTRSLVPVPPPPAE